MPFKSEAQRRKFAEMVATGKMSQATFDEWNKDTPGELPERLGNSRGRTPKSFDDLKQIKKSKGF